MNLPIEWRRSPNFTPGRPGAIGAIVLHYTAAMTLESTLYWFAQRTSQVSAHYVIGRDGRIVQMVKDEDTAWHAGNRRVNQESIGIGAGGAGGAFALVWEAIRYLGAALHPGGPR